MRAGGEHLLFLSSVLLAFASIAQPCQADENSPPIVNMFGSAGILDMPSGHMLDDGSFGVWVAGGVPIQRYGLTFQALPWLEGSFRYIATTTNPVPSDTQKLNYDRSFGLRIRLQDETDGWPDITLGFLDIVGTSLEGGEYLAASKHLGSFDVTGGIGWGALAGTAMFKNPFIYLFPSFATRVVSSNVVNSGQVRFGQIFHGPNASLFGGVAYQTPIDGLDLLAEYSSDTYRDQVLHERFQPRMQFNFGASYQVTDSMQVGAALMYGTTPMVRVSFMLDPKKPQYKSRLGTPPPPVKIRDESEIGAVHRSLVTVEPALLSLGVSGDAMVVTTKEDPSHVSCEQFADLISLAHSYQIRELRIEGAPGSRGTAKTCGTQNLPHTDALFSFATETEPKDLPQALAHARAQTIKLARAQGLEIEALAFHGSQVDVAFTNLRYRTEPESYGRLARVLMETIPADFETFRIVSLVSGMPTREIYLPRTSLERVEENRGDGEDLVASVATDTTDRWPKSASVASYPKYDWGIMPVFNQSLFDPNEPYLYQLSAGLEGGVNFTPGLRLEGEVDGNILSNFNKLLPSNSLLPHVRSDQNLYYEHGKNGISNLQATYATALIPGFYGYARAGILEDMFSGAGAELLWRPEDSRIAIGVSFYEVWQRGFDRLFDLQPYHVATGHVNIYYQSPYYGLNFRLFIGRYLARDYGATFEIVRHFDDTGIEIGAFATFTNVPFSQFGEGSFDKGFIINIPIDWMLPIDNQSQFSTVLRPVTRDGGQEVEGEQTLYDLTQRTSYGEYENDVDQIVTP